MLGFRARRISLGLVIALGCTGTARPPADTWHLTPGTAVTFAEHVAPILYRQCVACHRPGGSAPFGLVTYAEARERAALIAAAVEARRMPPWLPEPGYGDFAGERRLSDHEIALIRQWARKDAPEGNPAGQPSLPSFPNEWELGEPDLIVEFPSYEVGPGGGDVYRNLVMRYPLAEGRYVRAVELRPGDPAVVHHARVMVDTTTSSREFDARDPGAGFDGMDLTSRAVNPDGFFVGWTPGKATHAGSPELAWWIEPGTDLVLQLHLRPGASRHHVSPRLGLHFASAPPARRPALILLGSKLIDIAPGERNYVVPDSFTLPVDVEVLSLYPHAHYLATEMEGRARLPNGETRWLLHIKDWDFNWQDEYRYRHPVRLPAGTTLIMRYRYDNSAQNPQNPHRPPQRVRFGSTSTDEMADLVVQVLPETPEDLAVLRAAASWKLHRDESLYRADAELRRGRDLLAQGDLHGAIGHFREAVLLRSSTETHYALGDALRMKGDTAGAIAQLQLARRLALESGDSGLADRIGRQLARLRNRRP